MARKRNRYTRSRRRGRFAWLFKLLVIVALVGALVVGATLFFRVEGIAVDGNIRYTADEISGESGIEMDENLVALPTEQIEKRLLKALPYLETVSVKRAFPNGVLIVVSEWDAVASVETEEGDWLISVGGKLLEEGDATDRIYICGLDALLPRPGTQLALPQSDEEKVDSLLELMAVLDEREMLPLVNELDFFDATKIYMTYDKRYEVILPLNADYDYKLQVLEDAMKHQLPTEQGTFDLTQLDYQAIFTPDDIK